MRPRRTSPGILLVLLFTATMLVGAAWQTSPADDYTSAFRRDQGWSGADGAYSLPLDDGRTLWIFGDTFFGTVLPDGSRSSQTWMARNSVALQAGPNPQYLQFYPEPFYLGRPGRHDQWFWPYHGVQARAGTIQVFLGRFLQTRSNDPFGFRQAGLDLADLDVRRSPKVTDLRPVPHFRSAPGSVTSWGNALAQDGPWTLVYGVQDSADGKRLLLARVPRGHLANFGTWRFFDGSGWATQPERAAVLADEVSNELSVHRSPTGQWLLISGSADLSSRILLRTAPAPQGPWSPATTLLTAPEAGPGLFAYNAKAHPELSDERGLLVSYNVNALDPERVLLDADIYRPRFLRIR